jgi:hypothetical protein
MKLQSIVARSLFSCVGKLFFLLPILIIGCNGTKPLEDDSIERENIDSVFENCDVVLAKPFLHDRNLEFKLAREVLQEDEVILLSVIKNIYPEYELDFAEMPDKIVEELVLSEELDIGFAAYVDKDKFEYDLINESEILFVPIKDSRFYERESVSVREIADEPLTLRNRNFATTRIMMQEFEKYGADPEIMLNTGGILRSLKLRKDGMANTVIIDSVAAQIESDELRTIPFTEELKWPLYIITKKGRGRSKAVDRFISFIKENRID